VEFVVETFGEPDVRFRASRVEPAGSHEALELPGVNLRHVVGVQITPVISGDGPAGNPVDDPHEQTVEP
jgi:hypothetical protein